MKTLLMVGAGLAALSMTVTAAQAQDGDWTLSKDLGTPYIDLIDNNFDAGFAANWAVNNATIDGSVTINQANIEQYRDLSWTTSSASEASSAASSFSDQSSSSTEAYEASADGLGSSSASSVSLNTTDITETASSAASSLTETASQTDVSDMDIALVNLGDVSAQAVGAINDGAIEIGQAGASESAGQEGALDLAGTDWAFGVSSAAYADDSHAEATYSADAFIGDADVTASGSFSTAASSYGPAQDFYASNLAYNNTDLVDGSVDIAGNGMSATSVSGLAAGAINTGSIISGFDTLSCGGCTTE